MPRYAACCAPGDGMTTALTADSETAIRQDMTARVARAKTSFAAGMASLPAPRRAAMHALYAFCREVDDIADDLPDEAERRRGLDAWRRRIEILFEQGEAEHPIALALRPGISDFDLAKQDFLDIIDGMSMDAGPPIVAPDWATLDLYCDRVASAVGRASVRIFGDAGPAAMQVAHHLGRALQLTNILRDLDEDGKRGRFYLPREILQKHNLPLGLAALHHPHLPSACRELAQKAAEHFTTANTAMRQANRQAMVPARMMGGYYAAILQRLIKKDWQAIEQRVTLPFWLKVIVMIHGRYFA